VNPSAKAHELILEAFRNAARFPPLGERLVRPTMDALHSQLSQHSQAIHAPLQLSGIEVDAFEERAAIIEYDGGLQRREAEAKALMSVLARRHSS